MPVPVSIVMPVHNAQPFISSAIESVLTQTFSEFELVVVDDHSTDQSIDCVHDFNDSRICVVVNEGEPGVANAFNLGFEASSGRYVARMDADDVSLPHRIESQMLFLDDRSDVHVVGGEINLLESGEVRPDPGIRPHLPGHVRWSLLFACSLAFPTTMMRREAFLAVGGCDQRFSPADDYDLWLRMSSAGFKLANLDSVVLNYRINPAGLSHGPNTSMREKTDELSERALVEVLGHQIGVDRSTARVLREPDQLSRFDLERTLSLALRVLDASVTSANEVGITQEEASAIERHADLYASRLFLRAFRLGGLTALKLLFQSSRPGVRGLGAYLFDAMQNRARRTDFLRPSVG